MLAAPLRELSRFVARHQRRSQRESRALFLGQRRPALPLQRPTQRAAPLVAAPVTATATWQEEWLRRVGHSGRDRKEGSEGGEGGRGADAGFEFGVASTATSESSTVGTAGTAAQDHAYFIVGAAVTPRPETAADAKRAMRSLRMRRAQHARARRTKRPRRAAKTPVFVRQAAAGAGPKLRLTPKAGGGGVELSATPDTSADRRDVPVSLSPGPPTPWLPESPGPELQT